MPFAEIADVGCGSGAVGKRLMEAYYSKLPYIPQSVERNAEAAIKAEEEAKKAEKEEEGKKPEAGSQQAGEKGVAEPEALQPDAEAVAFFPGLEGVKTLHLMDTSPLFVDRAADAVQEAAQAYGSLAGPRHGAGGQLGAGAEAFERHMRNPLGGAVPTEADLPPVKVEKAVATMEALPFKPNSLNMVTTSLALHWVNNLPGFLSQVMTSLKPDGVFIGAMLGGETLQELRSAFAVADTERFGELSRVLVRSPFASSGTPHSRCAVSSVSFVVPLPPGSPSQVASTHTSRPLRAPATWVIC